MHQCSVIFISALIDFNSAALDKAVLSKYIGTASGHLHTNFWKKQKNKKKKTKKKNKTKNTHTHTHTKKKKKKKKKK